MKKMKTINDVFDMLDLFYANKHLYRKIRLHRSKKRGRAGRSNC